MKARHTKKNVDPAVGRRMAEGMKLVGITQAELAAEAGGTVRGIQDNVSGKAMPGGRVLSALGARGVNVNWVLTGKGEKLTTEATARRDEAVEGVIDAYMAEEMLTTIVEAIDGVAQPLPAKEKARLITVATKLYKALSPEERARGFSQVVLAFFDVINKERTQRPVEAPVGRSDQEWPLVERRRVARRKIDVK